MKVVEKQSQQIAEQNRLIQELSARVQAVEAKASDTAVLATGGADGRSTNDAWGEDKGTTYQIETLYRF